MSSSIQTNPLTKKPYSANYFALLAANERLPVSQHLPRLLSAIKTHKVVIVVGETGSGKTTQLPKAILLDDELLAKDKKIALTQNRQLATKLVSIFMDTLSSTISKLLMFGIRKVGARIAQSLDVQLGKVVGLKYRGIDSTNSSTRLEVLTDG